MYRCNVLYGKPEDPSAFDDYYRDVHIPIASQMHGLAGWNLTWIDSQDGELETSIYLVADLCATDRKSMDGILASPEGQAAAADVTNFATGGVTFIFGDEETVPLHE